MSEPVREIRSLAEPLVRAQGLDLVDVQVRGSGPSQLVRVIVDRKGGVPIGTIQELSNELSAVLDAHDPIDDRYSLEVTSPGTDYPLSGPRDFERVEGRAVLIQHDAGEGRILQTRGTVRAAKRDAVLLEVDGSEVRIPYGVVVKASQTLPW